MIVLVYTPGLRASFWSQFENLLEDVDVFVVVVSQFPFQYCCGIDVLRYFYEPVQVNLEMYENNNCGGHQKYEVIWSY